MGLPYSSIHEEFKEHYVDGKLNKFNMQDNSYELQSLGDDYPHKKEIFADIENTDGAYFILIL
jgi:hypothetical protein